MIPQLFRTAVMRFLGSSNAAFRTIRYTWMRYLPQGITQMYWKYIEQETLALMKNEPDLYSRDGTLHVPSSLEHLRDIALDEFGEPLVGNPSDYLSTSYHRRDYALLALLGVQAFSQTWAWVIRVEPGASNGGYPTRYNYGWMDTQK
jgi:hypothetical protein